MTTQKDLAGLFLELHVPGTPLLMPNPWDVGSARLLAGLGFRALATTSSGHAAALGRSDGEVSREEALDHAAALASAVGIPVSADLENCFADHPDGVRETALAAAGTGVAGFSLEDWSGSALYDPRLAAERVAAAAGTGVVLTARAENHLRGQPDLADTIARLQAYQDAGADVLYAPGLTRLDDIRAVVSAVDRPVNVLALPNGPSVAELAAVGVARVSVGGAFSKVAARAVREAAREFMEEGTYGFLGGVSEKTPARNGQESRSAASGPPLA